LSTTLVAEVARMTAEDLKSHVAAHAHRFYRRWDHAVVQVMLAGFPPESLVVRGRASASAADAADAADAEDAADAADRLKAHALAYADSAHGDFAGCTLLIQPGDAGPVVLVARSPTPPPTTTCRPSAVSPRRPA
jgi:hypothetical protein